ncbi:MAG: hypothetical protein KAH10_05695 [Flavobacteriales bacterium]|nr:hypothetical protein [Flavobacteriales bacterium]
MFDIKRFSSLFLLTTIFLWSNGLYSQGIFGDDEEIIGTELNGIIYLNEFQAGFSLNTNGYSINARKSWSPNAFFERGYEASVVMIRHPKEINSYNPIIYGGSSYPYGKLNSLYALRFGFGENHEIAEKIDLGSVEINYFYYGGLSIGGVKPIYLEIIEGDRLVTRKYEPTEHTINNIYGGVPFTKGFSEIKIYPGIYAKFGLNFDYKVSTVKIATIETGMVIDYYFKEVPIMAKTKNYSYFLAYYVSINFGKKWN